MDELQQLLSQNPDALKQLMQLGTLDDTQAQLERQLAQAQALRTNMASTRHTGLGAALAGIGDMINAYHSRQLGDEANAGLKALPGQKLQGRLGFAQMLSQALRQRGSPSTPAIAGLQGDGDFTPWGGMGA